MNVKDKEKIKVVCFLVELYFLYEHTKNNKKNKSNIGRDKLNISK